MASTGKYNPIAWFRQKVADAAVAILTKPIKSYDLHAPNDLANLRRHVRKGDVILVEGNERISQCIKYLTQSSWSHSALYVGDEPLGRNPQARAEYFKRFGDDSESLVVEALVESGVVLSPLSKYRDFNIRICRPYNLSAQDLAAVLDEAIAAVGDQYDIKNVVDLARYFLPVTLVPARFRRQALHLGSGEPTRVICSSLIASCFMRVKFPIVPRYEQLPDGSPAPPRQSRLWPLARRQGAAPPGVFHPVPPWLVTPRDFDLSPYFEIIKFNIIENMRFDYHKILWAEDLTPAQIKKGA
ncbi:MAG TPA: YiiX/YebB-like N1pC/P60 family cysteine hydrolase [Candidatus Binataceae bacterium]|nr:YiiX/YebB-like N1pC/P60 family cysteine hydrolase [Candidatus Binataceae bacterium]